MQTKRQFLLPLLAAATAMMVAPYAHGVATVYDYPTVIGGDSLYTAGNNVGTVANATDTLNLNSGTLTFAGTTTIGSATVNIKAGTTMTATGANPVITANANNVSAPLVVNVTGGTLTAPTGQNAITGTAWTGTGANSMAVNITAGGVVNGDIAVAITGGAASTNIKVDGSTWNGGVPSYGTCTDATSSLTLKNATVNLGASNFHTSTLGQTAYAVTASGNNNVTGDLVTGNVATVLTMSFDAITAGVDVSNTWTGKLATGVAPATTSILQLGANVATANINLHVTGTIDTLQITQSAPGLLQVDGNAGDAAPLNTLNFNGLGGVAKFGGNLTATANALSVHKNQILTVAGNAASAAGTFDGTSMTTVTGNYTGSSTIGVSNAAQLTVGGNLATGNTLTTDYAAKATVGGNLTGNHAIVVGGSSQLTVTGTTTASTLNTNITHGTGAKATFGGLYTGSGAADVVAGTSVTFQGGYVNGGASTVEGTVSFLGGTVALAGNNLTTQTSGSALVTFGKADGSAPVAVTSSGGVLTSNAGQIVINKNVTLDTGTALTVAAPGKIWVGQGVKIQNAVTATGVIEFMGGNQITNATNAPGAAGTFKVHGTVDNAGVVSSLKLDNAYGPSATGTTWIVFDNAASYGQLQVTGAVNWNTNNSILVVEHTGGYVAVGDYQVLTASGTVTQGTTAVVTYITPSKTTTFTSDVLTSAPSQKNTNAITVTVTRKAGLNTFATDSNAQGILASINNVDKATFQAGTAGQQAVLNAMENFVSANSTNPAAINRAAQGVTANVSSIAAANQAVRTGIYTLGQRLDTVAYDMRAPEAYVAGANNGDAVWMRGTYTRINQKANSSTNYDGYTSNQYGAMIGFDTMRFMHATLGLGLGYSQSNSKDRFDTRSTNRVRSYQVMPYGSVTLGDRATKGFIDWFAGYTYNSVNGQRMVSFGNALGMNNYSYNSSIFSAKGTYGLDRVINRNLTFTPFVSALMSYQPSVTYTASGFAPQTVQNNSRLGLEFELGLKGVIRPDAGSKANTRIAFRAMGVWSAINNNLKTTGTLIGTQSYTYSVTQQKFGARAGVSGVFEVLNDLDLELSYDLEARSKYMSHTGFVEFKYHF